MALRLLMVGLGPIGCNVARQAAERKGITIVGAVDLDPAKIGRDLGEVIGLDRRLRVEVRGSVADALRGKRPDVVAHCTVSSLRAALPQLEALARARLPVVSTTEELSYPWRTQPRLAKRLDAAAKKGKVALLGTGVNPGFAMDTLPLLLTGVCRAVRGVEVDRVQDARIRRLPFQQKIGATLTPAEFAARVQNKTVRHVGLAESVSMIADTLGLKIDRITDEIQPKIAGTRIVGELLTVGPGQVCGLVQDGVGYRGDRPVVRLHMEAYLGAPETYDEVRIDGEPSLRVRTIGGFHGDVATASLVVNALPQVRAAAPGLHTMATLPIPRYFSGATTRRGR